MDNYRAGWDAANADLRKGQMIREMRETAGSIGDDEQRQGYLDRLCEHIKKIDAALGSRREGTRVMTTDYHAQRANEAIGCIRSLVTAASSTLRQADQGAEWLRPQLIREALHLLAEAQAKLSPLSAAVLELRRKRPPRDPHSPGTARS
jgi:hypothetical protein